MFISQFIHIYLSIYLSQSVHKLIYIYIYVCVYIYIHITLFIFISIYSYLSIYLSIQSVQIRAGINRMKCLEDIIKMFQLINNKICKIDTDQKIITHFSEIITKEICRAIYKEGQDIQLAHSGPSLRQ